LTLLVTFHDKSGNDIPAYSVNKSALGVMPTGTATNGTSWWVVQSPSGDLYATGIIGTWDAQQPPAYWKNWQLQSLPSIGGQPNGYAGGVGFAGNDIFFNGTLSSPSTFVTTPVYWVNGSVHEYPLSPYIGGSANEYGMVDF
jgi:hypothetical protein